MRTRLSWFSVCAAAAAGALACGCVNLTRSSPEKRYYVLEVTRPEAEEPSAGAPGLELRSLRGSPTGMGKGFLYRMKDGTFASDFYQEFLLPPEKIVTERARAWLTRSGLFGYVAAPGSQLVPDLVLEGSLTSVYGDFAVDGAPRAVLEVQFFLLRERGAETDLLLSRDYREEIPIENGEPRSLLGGWEEGLGRILESLERDLRAALGRSSA